MSVSLDLEGNEEPGGVEEEEVSFPVAGVVVGFSVDSTGHRPDSSSSHCYSIIFLCFNLL